MSQSASQPPGALYEIRYSEICPWLILVRSLRVSLLVRVLLLAFVGVVLTQWGWAVVDRVFSTSAPQLGRITETGEVLSQHGPTLVGPDVDNLPLPTQRVSSVGKYVRETFAGPLARGWAWLTEPFVRMASREASWGQCLALLLCGLWSVVVWSVFGGAITRIAALHLTRGEMLGPLAALQAAVSNWAATAGGPLIALAGAAALAAPLAVVGVLLRLDLLALVAGLLWLLALVWGLVLAVVLLGLLLGWPLLWATMGVERTDAFDGVSRCYAYVYQRPLQLVFYLLVASVLGLLGEFAVYYIAAAGVQLTEWTVSWGSGNVRATQLMSVPGTDGSESLGGMAATGAAAIRFWKSSLMAVAASYPLAFLWSAAVGIYLLLRRHVDSTEMDEINLDQGEPMSGLSRLTPDETGVPQVERDSENADDN